MSGLPFHIFFAGFYLSKPGNNQEILRIQMLYFLFADSFKSHLTNIFWKTVQISFIQFLEPYLADAFKVTYVSFLPQLVFSVADVLRESYFLTGSQSTDRRGPNHRLATYYHYQNLFGGFCHKICFAKLV